MKGAQNEKLSSVHHNAKIPQARAKKQIKINQKLAPKQVCTNRRFHQALRCIDGQVAGLQTNTTRMQRIESKEPVSIAPPGI